MGVVLQTLPWSYSSINQSVQNEFVAGMLGVVLFFVFDIVSTI